MKPWMALALFAMMVWAPAQAGPAKEIKALKAAVAELRGQVAAMSQISDRVTTLEERSTPAPTTVLFLITEVSELSGDEAPYFVNASAGVTFTRDTRGHYRVFFPAKVADCALVVQSSSIGDVASASVSGVPTAVFVGIWRLGDIEYTPIDSGFTLIAICPNH